MSIDFASIFAGAADEYVADSRRMEELTGKLIGKKFDDYLTRGAANHTKHLTAKKELRKIARRLKAYKLSNDKIGTILEQGKADEVLSYLDNFSKLDATAKSKFLKPLGGDIQNIVEFAPNYKESGLTLDQIVNKVGGKITGGMTVTDAFADVGQRKEGTLAKLFSINPSRMVSKQRKLYESVYGKDALAQAQRFATGTLTTEDLGFSGLIQMPDPIASKKVMDTLGGGSGYISSSSFNTLVKTDMAGILDASMNQAGTDFSVSDEVKNALGDNIKAKLQNYVREQQVEYNKNLPQDQKGLYTDEFRLQLANGMKSIVNEIRNPTPRDGGGGDVDMSASEIQMKLIDLKNKARSGATYNAEDWISERATLLYLAEKVRNPNTQKTIEDFTTEAREDHDLFISGVPRVESGGIYEGYFQQGQDIGSEAKRK